MFDPPTTLPEPSQHIAAAACRAQEQISRWPEARIHKLTNHIASRVDRASASLAAAVVEATGQGNPTDRRELLRWIAARGAPADHTSKPGVGFVGEDAHGHITLAEPIGLVLVLVSDELPVASALHIALAATRTRNAALLITPAPSLLAPIFGLMRSVLEDAGAPPDLIQICAAVTPKQLEFWLRLPEVSEVVVCGGGDRARAALRCGKPTLGLPVGNTPCVVLDDADAHQTAERILRSKVLDHGLHRAAEQQLIVTPRAEHAMIDALEGLGAALLSTHESNQLRDGLAEGALTPGLSAHDSAAAVGVEVPSSTTLLLVPAVWNPGSPWLRPVQSPILPVFSAQDPSVAFQLARRIAGSAGPSLHAAIHTDDDDALAHYVAGMPAGRILINTGATHSALGVTGKLPCSVVYSAGPRGAENITYENLRILKRVIRNKEG